MFRLCARTFTNHNLKHIFISHKHNKLKSTFFLTLCAQLNPIFTHASVNSLLTRNIHTNIHLKARIFRDSENTYAYNILQTIPVSDPEMFKVKIPNETVSTLDKFNNLLNQNWRSKSASEIVEAFKGALNYCIHNNIAVSDERFDKLTDGLMDRVQDLTDSELSELLACLAEYPPCDSYTSHNFHDIWSALDDVCCWRLGNWSNETRFLFVEHWYRLNLGKLSDFVHYFIDRMQKRLKFMSKNEVVHMFFHLKTHKRHKVSFEFQHALDEHIGDMSLKEIALVAMALTSAKTKLKLQPTVECIISKLKQELLTADEICIRRTVENFTRDFNLNFLTGKVGKYMAGFIESLLTKLERLTKAQLIHTFFYINLCRNRFVDVGLESALEKHIHAFNADEMAIVAMGFFKTQSRVRLKLLLGAMIEQIKSECRTIHEIALTAILKVLRYSSHVLLVDQLMDLLDRLVPEIDRLSNLCCIHIALLGTTLLFFHEESLEKVSQKIASQVTDPSQVRLKDLERLLVALTMFDYDPKTNPGIFDAIYKELHTEERRKEIVQYPRCLPSALTLLSMRNMYSYELMNETLDMDSVLERYGKNPKLLPRDVFSLDVCVDVECPDYQGKRLDRTFRRKATRWLVEYTPVWNQYKKLTAADKFFLNVMDTVAKVVGDHQNLHAEHVLPNYVKSDIIICRDARGNFVQPTGFEGYILGDVMQPLNQSLEWFAIVPVSWNNVIRNTSKPLGLINMKYRQLKAIGYVPILVIWDEFLPLQKRERMKYIRNKIE